MAYNIQYKNIGSLPSRFIGIIIRPNSTLQEANSNPHLEDAAFCIAFYTITNIISRYLMGAIPFVPLLFDWIIYFTVAIILCMLIALGLHLFAKVLGGKGTYYPNMIVATSYSFIIMAIGNVINILQSMIGINSFDTTSLAYIISGIILIILVIWMGYLWFLSLKNIEQLKSRGSIAITVIVMILYMILQLILAVF